MAFKLILEAQDINGAITAMQMVIVVAAGPFSPNSFTNDVP